MRNTVNKNIKIKNLETTNFCIKVYILCLLTLLNLFFESFIKQKSRLLPVSLILDLIKHNF